jgi:hypothetical protein
MPLSTSYVTGQSFGAADINATNTAVNALALETVNVSSASTLTLAGGANANYVFTGTTATWTLPALAGNTGVYYLLENRGSGAITLNPAGSDHIWWKSSLTTVTIAAGGSLPLLNDGTYWNSLSVDLVNNSVGILAVANGGTGQSSLTSLTLVTPVLGTPTSGTLTNCTFPTLNQSTSGSAATLTTPRAINGVNFDGSAAITILPRIATVASSATPVINTDTTDVANILTLAIAVTSMTTSLSGTPVDGQKLIIRFKDTGVAKAITWGASFLSSGVATLLATTVGGKTHHVGLIYDGAATVWRCVAVDSVGY